MGNKNSVDDKSLKLWKEYEFFLSTGYEISYQNFIKFSGDTDKCIKYIDKQNMNKNNASPNHNSENKQMMQLLKNKASKQHSPQISEVEQKVTIENNDLNDGNCEQKLNTLNMKVSKIKIVTIPGYSSTSERKFITTGLVNIPPFEISMKYSSSTTWGQLTEKIEEFMTRKVYPKCYKINRIHLSNKEIAWVNYSGWSGKKLIDFGISNLSKVIVEVKDRGVLHKVHSIEINCPHMVTENTVDVLKCPVYLSMKHQYKFTETNLNHLNNFIHFQDEYNEKPECKYNQQCWSFNQLENGGDRLDDKCHMKIYRHPPRNNRVKSNGLNAFSVRTGRSMTEGEPYRPSEFDDAKYKFNDTNGYLLALIDEVVQNGFRSDLCLTDVDVKNNEYTLLNAVDYKLKHNKHTLMGSPLRKDHMLALILYTGCDCNYDLCKSQRNGDYDKWKWFDYCLWHGIEILSNNETGSYKVYSGLNNVHWKKDVYKEKGGWFWFKTYVSSSWIKDVSTSFMGDKGMILEINEEFRERNGCCDVSWISKFPDECEILIKRGGNYDCFTLDVLDQQQQIQTVSLKFQLFYT